MDIATYIEEKNISVEEFAKEVGVNYHYMLYAINGDRKLGERTMRIIGYITNGLVTIEDMEKSYKKMAARCPTCGQKTSKYSRKSGVDPKKNKSEKENVSDVCNS